MDLKALSSLQTHFFIEGLWSYAGWYNLNYVYEELKRPEVTMNICIILCVLYFIQQYNRCCSQ